MNRVLKVALVSAAFGAAAIAAPATASTVVVAQCDSVTDGDAQGCLFSGNINESPDPTNKNSYKNAEAAYNALMNPDITLNWITGTDASNFSSFGTFTGEKGKSGTFNLPGWDVQYYAVKAGNQFALYQYTGSNTWAVPGKNGLSHLAFFGNRSTVQSGVPEPTTWAMMLMGFGGIGFSMRRKARNGTSLQVG
ncbi:PEP-CTERM sorting domain-containing protein [Sphingomonas piscis]|uniref:PEP-CTERM sorting domain-containing protein n=1 Tax=Sphingomonas piscis TaxID=2714943 RepID=A0A6G7YQT9_9SPHN|nr:PEPxxWA-CTERM sorting domain-containing protein [Sphingomonas piscis]QIK79102.1 PEP-CTERM sorting domain-containing protein [Sphingomonas piscis]